MKRQLTLLLALLIAAMSYSQSKFGDVTQEELEMKVYPNDTTASAVILLKEGETRFVYDDVNDFFKYEYTIKMKIKILKEDGLNWCNHEVEYYEGNKSVEREDVRGLSGTTYNLENGKIIKTKLSNDYIFEEDINNKYKLRKFTLPGAKVGSVIEYKYTVVSRFFIDLRGFVFQSSIPTARVRCEISIPEYFKYNLDMRGYETINTKKSPENGSFNIRYKGYDGRMYNERISYGMEKIMFSADNIPALKPEPYVWCLSDYISKVTFELNSFQLPHSRISTYSTNWADIDKELCDNEFFGGNLKRANLFKNDAVAADNPIEGISLVLNMIKKRVKWNGKNSMSPTNLKDALKDGLANSAGVNFLLINALKASGFEAYPVVLSTRENGRIPISHPSILAFNNTITAVKIDTAYYFTDASDIYGSWNVLPEKCMVDRARVIIDKDRAFWKNLSRISQAKIVVTGNVKLEDMQIKTEYVSSYSDMAARDYRKDYYAFDSREAFIEDLATKNNGTVLDYEITGLDTPGSAVKYQYTLEKDMDTDSEIMYLNPMIDMIIPKSLFTEETRKLPINFNYPLNYTQLVTINVPEGYVVEELPISEKLITDNEDLQLLYRINVLGGGKIIRLDYRFKINKLLFLQTDYEMLKDFFGKAVSKNTEQIVLKKVSQ